MEGSSRRIFVCLISRQTMQHLLPILQYRPQQVVCITTTQEDESRHHLEAVLRAHLFIFTQIHRSTSMPIGRTRHSQPAARSLPTMGRII